MSDTKCLVCGQSWSQPQVKLRVIQPFRLGSFSHFGPNKGPESLGKPGFLRLQGARQSKTRPNRHAVCHLAHGAKASADFKSVADSKPGIPGDHCSLLVERIP